MVNKCKEMEQEYTGNNCTLAPFIYTYEPYATFFLLSFGDVWLGQDFF